MNSERLISQAVSTSRAKAKQQIWKRSWKVCYTCCSEYYKFLQHSLQEFKWFKKLEVCRGAPLGH